MFVDALNFNPLFFFLDQLSYKSIVLADVSVKGIATRIEKVERRGDSMAVGEQGNPPIQLMFVCSK
jgi:hypothetical protein